MKKIKEIWKRLDKKLKWILMGLVIFIIIIIALVIIKGILGSRIDGVELEYKLEQAAQKYYNDYANGLPKDGENITISYEKLESKGYIKKPEKLLKENLSCKGEVAVENNRGNYLYSATVDCGKDYKTKKLYEKIIENIVTQGDGLYEANGAYVYRGEYIDNYVRFAEKDWRILRVNNDHTIRMMQINLGEDVYTSVWDDRYNKDQESSSGFNDYHISRIKETLHDLWESDYLINQYKAYIKKQNLCIGGRKNGDTQYDGSLECGTTYNDEMIGMIQVNEFMLATLDKTCEYIYDPQCTNYNYLANIEGGYWSITKYSKNNYQVYAMDDLPSLTDASSEKKVRPVIHLSANTNYISGSGTKKDPYIIKNDKN